ncbi:uncharacterized protein LOC120584411 [Pteropus medius]|uniref:uncharacterized protein LOC120584411 n=1 Tax=Pteropus vampyrus TaxID=132908 RepID=UPI00196A4E3D|nr:uncharacterized protein LOC120584411 [Pteropus giganteus]
MAEFGVLTAPAPLELAFPREQRERLCSLTPGHGKHQIKQRWPRASRAPRNAGGLLHPGPSQPQARSAARGCLAGLGDLAFLPTHCPTPGECGDGTEPGSPPLMDSATANQPAAPGVPSRSGALPCGLRTLALSPPEAALPDPTVGCFPWEGRVRTAEDSARVTDPKPGGVCSSHPDTVLEAVSAKAPGSWVERDTRQQYVCEEIQTAPKTTRRPACIGGEGSSPGRARQWPGQGGAGDRAERGARDTPTWTQGRRTERTVTSTGAAGTARTPTCEQA